MTSQKQFLDKYNTHTHINTDLIIRIKDIKWASLGTKLYADFKFLIGFFKQYRPQIVMRTHPNLASVLYP